MTGKTILRRAIQVGVFTLFVGAGVSIEPAPAGATFGDLDLWIDVPIAMEELLVCIANPTNEKLAVCNDFDEILADVIWAWRDGRPLEFDEDDPLYIQVIFFLDGVDNPFYAEGDHYNIHAVWPALNWMKDRLDQLAHLPL